MTIHEGLSPEYRETIKNILGDAAPHYIAMLERLCEVSNTWKPENDKEVLEQMKVIGDEIGDYVTQFGFSFFALLLRDKSGKQRLRMGLIDKTSSQLAY